MPACVLSGTHIGLGTGHPSKVEGWKTTSPVTPVLLVNPRVPLSHRPRFFKAWGRGGPRARSPKDLRQRSQGKGPATTSKRPPFFRSARLIAEVLAALGETAPWLARHVPASGRDLLCAL